MRFFSHCTLYFRSGREPLTAWAWERSKIEAFMAQAQREARKKGDEVLYWNVGTASDIPENRKRFHIDEQPQKNALQLPNAPFDV